MLRSATLIASGLLIAPDPSDARTWIINPDGTGDAPTIQAAVDSTALGDTIFVSAGDYEGPVRLKPGTHLVGEAPTGSASIMGPSESDVAVSVSSGTVAGLELGGVYGTRYGPVAAAIRSRDSVVEDCILRDSRLAVYCRGSLTLTDCDIRGTYGVRMYDGDRLEIRRCEFENSYVFETPIGITPRWMQSADLIVSDCVFLRNEFEGQFPMAEPTVGWLAGTSVRASVTNNLFFENGAPAVGPTGWSVESRRYPNGEGGGSTVEISNNTIVGSSTAGLGSPFIPLPPGAVVRANLFVGNSIGLDLTNAPGVLVSCNLAWNNGQNWVGFPDPTGVDGNLSEPPLFCDFELGDFTAASNSPLLPANNSCGVQIGAFGVGCGEISVTPSTWGQIKALYRN